MRHRIAPFSAIVPTHCLERLDEPEVFLVCAHGNAVIALGEAGVIAAITDQDFININENRGGLVEFESAGVKLFGRIAEAEFDANKKIINFELNRAYGI